VSFGGNLHGQALQPGRILEPALQQRHDAPSQRNASFVILIVVGDRTRGGVVVVQRTTTHGDASPVPGVGIAGDLAVLEVSHPCCASSSVSACPSILKSDAWMTRCRSVVIPISSWSNPWASVTEGTSLRQRLFPVHPPPLHLPLPRRQSPPIHRGFKEHRDTTLSSKDQGRHQHSRPPPNLLRASMRVTIVRTSTNKQKSSKQQRTHEAITGSKNWKTLKAFCGGGFLAFL